MKSALLITLIITSILSFNLWMLLPFAVFYKGLAIVLFLSAVLIRYESVKGTPYRYLCDLWLLLTINNLIDEFLFNPKIIQWNEYVIGAVIIFHAVYKIKKNGKAQRGTN